MKINKIKINSYGKLKEKEIKLKDGINIIYGKNESGKSTLLNFIVNSFYGISKNKKGKEYSDVEKYTPWLGEEFSGKLEYELNNKNKYEIYRDFKKKNPKIFNENMEDISKEFNIDKSKGNEFFYEQTKVDKELFLSTVVVGQQEVKLGKQEQNILVQKIANLVGTGDDNVSYKRAMDRINRRLLDEIGTQRSREKPINIINKKIEDLEQKKQELEKYEDIKYEIEENKNKLEEEISDLNNKNNLLKEIKIINEKEKIEKEKIKIKENIKKENIEKIKLIKEKINKIKNENKDILKSAEKAQDFIRLYKIKEYADYYKSIDKGYELPVEAKVFIKIQDELNINSINEAYAIIDNARDVRLELHQMKSSVLELQRQLNKLDTLKEEQLIKTELFIHNIKFGGNRIDYENSTDDKWCVKLPYCSEYMFIEKSQTTFNNKYQYYTMFLVDDKKYNIYTEDEIKEISQNNKDNNKKDDKNDIPPSMLALKGTDIENMVLANKTIVTQQYNKDEKE